MSLSNTPASLGLYYIKAYDENGENLDLLVEAFSAVQAVILWDLHFDLTGQVTPEYVSKVPLSGTGKAGVIPWADLIPE